MRDSEAAAFETPSLFPAEVRNALLKLERRGFYDARLATTGLARLAALPIVVQPPLDEMGSEPVMALAREERLSFYDACYLDLCLTRSRPLASRDKPLLQAAERCGIEIIDAGADS